MKIETRKVICPSCGTTHTKKEAQQCAIETWKNAKKKISR